MECALMPNFGFYEMLKIILGAFSLAGPFSLNQSPGAESLPLHDDFSSVSS